MNENTKYSSWGVWSSVLVRMRELCRPLFLVHLAYVALGFVFISPLIGLFAQLPLLISGRPVLADQDILYFFLSPTGLICLVFLAGIVIAFMAAEQTSMLAMAVAWRDRQSISVFESISFAGRRFPHILMLSVFLTGRVLALAAPFLIAGAVIAWLLITRYDINYYLTARPLAFWVAVGTSCALVVAMTVLVSIKLIRWSLVFPLVLFRGSTPRQAFSESSGIVAGAGWAIFQAIAIWALLGLGLSVITFAAVEELGNWIVPPFMQTLEPLILVIGGILILWIACSTIVTALTSMSFALLLVELSDRHKIALPYKFSQKAPRKGAGEGMKMTPASLGLILGGGLIASLIAGSVLLDNIRIGDNVMVVAHRGASGAAPENTLAAVRQAISDGADWIEIDVQETADGEVVVFHDGDFMRQSKVNLKIWDATMADIAELDIGSWFAAEFSAERAPTLRAVLDEARGKANILIELKYYGHDKKLEERVVRIVENARMVPEIAVMSLNHEGLRKLQALRPKWNAGFVIAKSIGDPTRLDAQFLAVHVNMATSAFIRRSHEAGKKVLVWTVNDALSMSRFMSLGADGLITDEPALARRVLAEREEMNAAERLLLHVVALFDLPARRSLSGNNPL